MTAVHPHAAVNEPRPGSSSGGFAFPRSGLGTPDFMCFGGSTGGTPSWYRQPKEASVKEEYDSDGALPPAGSTNASTTENTEEPAGSEDGSRAVRAASDPPIRQSPAWLIPKSKLDQEPNPFEHSFSGKNPFQHVVAPPRRARSQSPKSSHGGHTQASSSANQSNNIPVKMPNFGSMSTPPPPDFANYGWASHYDSHRSGSGYSSMLNGPLAGYSGGMFDPTSIRTGLTPRMDIENSGFATNATPHSPATQALFAMMTNATPGLPSIPKMDSDYSSSDNIENQRNAQQSNHGSHSGSNSSGRSPQNNGHVHSQAMPKPIQTSSIYGPRPTGPQPVANNTSQYAGYQHSQTLLSQPAPRPLPSQVFRNSGAPPPGAAPLQQQGNAPPSHFSTNTTNPSRNPLFLLSQAQSQLNPGDNVEDDTVLAAAALSGLATPRPAYVGGPPPVPTHLQHAASSHFASSGMSGSSNISLQAPPPLQERRPPPAARANSANNTGSATKGKKAAGGNKRKKAASPAPNASNSKKPKRNTRKTATQPIVDQDTLSDEDDNLLDMDDDTMSMNGSVGKSENGGNNAGESGYPDDDESKSKGGRGSKQQFETEEEKRKNFLERNRQAALKCRQRKKQWLSQLQQKVENLTSDNEVLQQTCSHLREEVMTLRNILLSHKDCPLGNPGGAGSNVTIGGLLAAQTHQGVPHQQLQPRPF